jgi:ABC-type sugar transport system substrate-binding protein
MFTRKLLARSVLGAAVVALAACGGSGSGSPAASTATVAPTVAASAATSTAPSAAPSAAATGVKSIFFANPLPAYPDWGTADKCFNAEIAKLGLKGVTQGPTGLAINDQFVLDRISQAIAGDYDGLMAVPITPPAYDSLFDRAKKDGMHIATLNTGDATKNQDFTVGTDYPTQGAQVAANIAKRQGQQNVGIITNAPGGIGDVIIKAFNKDLPANVKVVATAFDNADPAKTADVAAQMLTAHPEINIIFSWEGTAVAGITTAIKEKNKVGKVFGVVNDLTPQVVDGIREGTIYGTSQQHFCEMAKQSVDKLVAVGQGQQVPAATDTGTTFVTKDNLDTVLAAAAAAQ